jgi:hypothetical protein
VLPKAGDWRQFCIQASRIDARPPDRARPLSEIYVVAGLDRLLGLAQGSCALLTKIHHAAVDAEGGCRIATLPHEPTRQAPKPPSPKPVPAAGARCRSHYGMDPQTTGGGDAPSAPG